jgi:hypothetical protein
MGSVQEIRARLQAGADPNQPGGVNDWTPLMHAIHKGQRQSVAALLAGGADPNARTPKGGTALMMAAGYGDDETVRLLLAAGADPHVAAADGSTALTHAVGGTSDIDNFTLTKCQTATVQELLKKAPDLRLPDSFHGRMARRFARWGHCEEVLRLVENQPDLASNK